jgi:hypothetical protein
VVVPVFEAVAKLMKPRIQAAVQAKKIQKKRNSNGRRAQPGSSLKEHEGDPLKKHKA